MSRHTPGPWKVDTQGPPHIVIMPEIADHGCGFKYAAVGGGNEDANTALIAAAPDMLEALNNLIGMWRNGRPMYKGQAEYHDAIAAVRKARGES